MTPNMLVAAYEFLCLMPPFSRWHLPVSDEVEFHVMRQYDREGDYEGPPSRKNHLIRCSSRWIGHTDNLLRVMAHEMIHLHQRLRKSDTPNTNHNREFVRLADQVATTHGWDPRLFT